MTRDTIELFRFDDLPFVIGTAPVPGNCGLPDSLPFSLGLCRRTGRLVQRADTTVSRALEDAYKLGSLVTGFMKEDGIGRCYADDFVRFIAESLGTQTLASSRVLEIGCGTGYLLHRLNLMGADVMGVEPGPQGQEGKEKYHIPVQHGFFPVKEDIGTYDLIILYGILEHIEDPLGFLNSLHSYLLPGGKIVVGVPSCDNSIQHGDVSMLLHEHWSYFSAQSLGKTLEASGFEVLKQEPAGFGGVWYAVAAPHLSGPTSGLEADDHESRAYVRQLRLNLNALSRFLDEERRKERSVGFYCPARIVNALSLAMENPSHRTNTIRFFDDNKLLQGNYYPGLPYPIESREKLISAPVNSLVIASWTFGEQLRDELKKQGLKSAISTFADLFSH